MKVAVQKYDIHTYLANASTEVRRAQVVCLYWKENESFSKICQITSYALSTVKSYVNKYEYLTKEYDNFFNKRAPQKYEYVCTPLDDFDDGYLKVEVPKECGLYLVGSTHFDPLTGKTYYWIKVGMSTNLFKRLRGYHSENPMIYVADTLITGNDVVCDMEHDCHVMLSDVAMARAENTAEWFLVDKDTYMNICQQGFNYFFTKW